MSASRALEYHRSVSRVAKWCAWYTRDLTPTVAAARREEIASDLYEHGAFADGGGADYHWEDAGCWGVTVQQFGNTH